MLASKINKNWSFLSQGELERANTARLLLRYGWVRIDTETREKERGRERERKEGKCALALSLSLSLFFPCLSDTLFSPSPILFNLSLSLSLSFTTTAAHYISTVIRVKALCKLVSTYPFLLERKEKAVQLEKKIAFLATNNWTLSSFIHPFSESRIKQKQSHSIFVPCPWLLFHLQY